MTDSDGMDWDFVNDMTFILNGGKWKKAPRSGDDDEIIEEPPDIDELLESLNNNTKIWESMKDVGNLKFPDDQVLHDIAGLEIDIAQVTLNYFTKDEMRKKFEITMQVISNQFKEFVKNMEHKFDMIQYEVKRIDYQLSVQDKVDKWSRRIDVVNAKPTKQKTEEFKKAYDYDMAITALETLRSRLTEGSNFIWTALKATNNNDEVFEYWRIMVTTAVIILIRAHFKYRAYTGVKDKDNQIELGKIKKTKNEIKELLEEIAKKRSEKFKN